MKPIVPLIAAAAIPAAALAQPVPPGVEVDRIGLEPGEAVSFTLARGDDHQLLRIQERGAAAATANLPQDAVSASYSSEGGLGVLRVANGTEHVLRYDLMADIDGNGGFRQYGVHRVEPGATHVDRWARTVPEVNIGGFVHGPHGDHEHEPYAE